MNSGEGEREREREGFVKEQKLMERDRYVGCDISICIYMWCKLRIYIRKILISDMRVINDTKEFVVLVRICSKEWLVKEWTQYSIDEWNVGWDENFKILDY